MTETLFPIENVEIEYSNHFDRMVKLLTVYSEKGISLAYLTERHMLDRSLRTLQTYCNAAGIIFPDWCPRRLRPKKVKVARPQRRRRR